MPYKVVDDHPDCPGYAVVKEGTSDMMGCHETRESANEQLKALYAGEPDAAHSLRPRVYRVLRRSGRYG